MKPSDRGAPPPTMELPTPIAILSDLHWGHPMGVCRHASQFERVIGGHATVIFNGDTVEARVDRLRPVAEARLEELRALCAGLGARAVFVTGNHDPRITSLHSLSVGGGRVLVTHGDVLFETLTPWSRFVPELRQRAREEWARLPAGAPIDLATRLEIARRLSARAPHLCSGSAPGRAGSLGQLAAEFLHPFRPLAVVRCWLEVPKLAVELARTHAPEARVVVVGHTHLPGCWRRGDRWVINTGSFAPLGAWATVARIDEDGVTVRRITARRGAFVAGRELARIPLSD